MSNQHDKIYAAFQRVNSHPKREELLKCFAATLCGALAATAECRCATQEGISPDDLVKIVESAEKSALEVL